MTWGTERRKRLADFFGDAAKIVLAVAVVTPVVQPGGSPIALVTAGVLITVICLVVSLSIDKE